MSRNRRVYHPGLIAGEDEIVELSAEESRHVQRVLRLRADDTVVLFDGEGSQWQGSLVSVTPAGVRVRVGERESPAVEAAIDVHLYQGLSRYDRIEWVIQKATELGVRSIQIIGTTRSEVPSPPEARLVRWRRLAVEACKQSGRTRVPAVGVVLELPIDPEAPGLSLVLDADPDSPTIGEAFAALSPPEIRLAVGPEGGFTREEIDRWTGGGWGRAGLGPRTLRTETAGIVAVALAVHAYGDLGAC